MKAGQVLDLTPLNVRKWGDLLQEQIDGQKYWAIMVDATVQTMSGPIDTQAVAHTGTEKWRNGSTPPAKSCRDEAPRFQCSHTFTSLQG